MLEVAAVKVAAEVRRAETLPPRTVVKMAAGGIPTHAPVGLPVGLLTFAAAAETPEQPGLPAPMEIPARRVTLELRLRVCQKHFPAVMRVMEALQVLVVLAVLVAPVLPQGHQYPGLALAVLTPLVVAEAVMVVVVAVTYTNAHPVWLVGLGVVVERAHVTTVYPDGVLRVGPAQKTVAAETPEGVMVGFLMATTRMAYYVQVVGALAVVTMVPVLVAAAVEVE